MATRINSKQVVSSQDLLISQIVQQETLTRLLTEKGIFTKDEFLETVKALDQKIREKR